MLTDSASGLPLADWAGHRLAKLADIAASPAIAALNGASLLGERATLNHFRVPGLQSAGGGCRLLPARGDWIALNLARSDDRELLPALLGSAAFDPQDDVAIARAVTQQDATTLLQRGREMGMAIAMLGEQPASPARTVLSHGLAAPPSAKAPRVLDLSALWAGPLAGHLFWLAGAEVTKVESARRPDSLRTGDPVLFALLNQGKANVALDLATAAGRAGLLRLIEQADIVIEAARPRALRQLGIDTDTLVRARPGLVWLTITGHGASGPAADWVGFGDDCSVAGGLSAELARVTGQPGFVGDALADPLTGIEAALAGWQAWRAGAGCRIGLAMSSVVAQAWQAEARNDPARWEAGLRAWAAVEGAPFPTVSRRTATAPVAALGGDTARLLPC